MLMKNIDAKKLVLFDKEYFIYNRSCCSNTTKRTLYIELLNICNAKCSFCSLSCNNNNTKSILNLEYAKEVISELVAKGAIDKVSLTGGEPLLYPRLQELLDFLDSLTGNGIEFYALTTNGILLEKYMSMLENSKIKYINISRHHYDQAKNDRVFGVKTLSEVQLKNIITQSQKSFRFNVTITEDFYTLEDVHEYIKMAQNIGINNILIRKEYQFGKNSEIMDKVFCNYDKCKKSTKCECRIKKINGVEVEYRVVDVEKEKETELSHEYVRNFVLKHDNKLLGGWSESSLKIY